MCSLGDGICKGFKVTFTPLGSGAYLQIVYPKQRFIRVLKVSQLSIGASKVVDYVFRRSDIGIYCLVCKKECIFEWVVFRKGERSISQNCLVHGHLRLTPMVPAYIERVKSESLLQFMNDTPSKCRGCSKQGACKLVEQGFTDICGYGSDRFPEIH